MSAESYGSLLSAALMSKLPSDLRLTVSCKLAGKYSWDFANLLKVIEEKCKLGSGRLHIGRSIAKAMAHQLELHCSSSHHSTTAVSVVKTTPLITVEQLLALNLVVTQSGGVEDATVVLEEVICIEIAAARSYILAARGNIM